MDIHHTVVIASSFVSPTSLAYTTATIYEIQRVADLVPFVPHQTTEPTVVEGYHIPASNVLY